MGSNKEITATAILIWGNNKNATMNIARRIRKPLVVLLQDRKLEG